MRGRLNILSSSLVTPLTIKSGEPFRSICERINHLIAVYHRAREERTSSFSDIKPLIKDLIKATGEFIELIPQEKRSYLFGVGAMGKLYEEFPELEPIFKMHKQLVQQDYLPDAQTLSQARWARIKQLSTSVTPSGLGPPRMLQEGHWSEVSYTGDYFVDHWLKNEELEVRSYSEKMATRQMQHRVVFIPTV